MGAVTPLGNTLSETWQNLLAGKSGVRTITRFPLDGYTTTIAAEVINFDPQETIEKKQLRRMDLSEIYSIAAAQMAYDDADLANNGLDSNRCGVIVGSGIGGIQTLESQHRTLIDSGPGRISPFFIPMMIIDMCAGLISMRFSFKGPNYATVSACASSAHAIADAFRVIQRDEADVMITGGAEAAITPLSIAGFCAARALSTRNDEPEKASRPFDKDRDGFVMGEGSGMLILESLESAEKRGAKIYAEIIGAGMTCDAHHITAPIPDGSGAAGALERAIRDAKLDPAQVDYINSHGTATELGDIAETKAIKRILGEQAEKVSINATKSMVGHLLGAAGAFESIVTALSIHEGVIHPTINLETPDPECDLDYTPGEKKTRTIEHGVSNSFGFGGHNISLVFKAVR
jgi:3-oxoacyl-[acyl-carrier-protein] synthase II